MRGISAILVSVWIMVLLGFILLPNAFALTAPNCTLEIPGGIDVASFSCTFQAPDTIVIDETWIGKADPYIKISNLDPGENYKIEKTIRNFLPASETMKTVGHELLDPDNGSPSNDDLDQPCSSPLCPTGFTLSNDFDLLSFDQEPGLPPFGTRTSLIFSVLSPDEFGTIDFFDFTLGEITNGGFDVQTYGLRDENFDGDNQPFLLRETITPVAPCMGPGCNGPVGGIFEGVDTISLLLNYAILNAIWMAPIGIGIGVGFYLVKRRF